MRKSTSLLVSVLFLLPGAVLAQDGSPPLPPIGLPISDLSLHNRLQDAASRRTAALATLELTYTSGGDLKTVLVKNNPQSLFLTLEVAGVQIKNLSRTRKTKIQEAVTAGPIRIKARWTRPGTKLIAVCEGWLSIGFQEALFYPFGGTDGFSCQFGPRTLSDDILDVWKQGLAAEKAGAFYDCSHTHPRASAELWACVDSAGIPLPQG